MRKSYILLPIILALLSLVLVAACLAPGSQTSAIPSPIASPTPRPPFSGESAHQYVQAQMAFGPRPTGTEAHRKTGDYIIAQLKQLGWQVEEQPFEYQGVQARNIIAKQGAGRGKPIVILGAHYDTRRQADNDPDPKNHTQPVPGANDGASGVAVLLEMARTLDVDKTGREIWLAFFDAEDNGRLDGWDWIQGSTYMATHLTVTPTAMILADMIGDADQQLYWDRNSDQALNQQLWQVAATLGYTATFIPQHKWTMIDDHVPFRQRGIPAVDLIDFDYPYWHTVQDTTDKVGAVSLERIGRTITAWLEQTAP
jgi:hypothetical protein